MKVTAILKGKADEHGRIPIYIRTHKNGVRTYKKTPLRIAKANFKKGKVFGPLAEDYNTKIKTYILAQEHDKNEPVKDLNFYDYYKQCQKEWGQSKAYSTNQKYDSEIRMLKEYKSHFMVSELTPEFLRGYLMHCYDQKTQGNTVWRKFKFLRTMCNQAFKDKLITSYPFDHFDMPKYRAPKRQFLTRDQVQKVEDFIPMSGTLQLCATWFVIGCFTGLRYSDMQAFDRKKNIRDGRLVVYTTKTGEVVSMPLSEKVKKLMESIGYQNLFISNQKYNNALKKVAAHEACKLPPLTGHTSRHTFATLAASMGISQEVTAKLLGHSDLKSTGIYYKLVNTRIDKEMEKFG
jgi:integrase/recombinase XerD